MTEEKFGIENLKVVLALGVSVGKQAASSLEDGKITFQESIQMALSLVPVGDLLKRKEDILNEAKDLSMAEIEELVASVQGAITNEKVVATIGYGLDIAIAVTGLIELYK